MEIHYPSAKRCIFAVSFGNFFNISLSFENDLFDPCRVYSSIMNKLRERHFRYLHSDRVKAGDNDSARSVINNNIHPCCSLESSNISTFSPDDSSFHFIVRNCYSVDSHFRNTRYCKSINRRRYNLACLPLCFIMCFFHCFIEKICCIPFYFVSDFLEKIIFCFFCTKTRCTF